MKPNQESLTKIRGWTFVIIVPAIVIAFALSRLHLLYLTEPIASRYV